MPRYVKNTLITAKIETTYGVDSVPTGAANALLISDQSITPLDAQNIDRDLVRGSFGASEQLVGPASVKLSYSVELAGSGTAGTAPAWGALLQACACSEGVLATPARVEYMPASTGLKSLTQYYFDDGLLHKLLGCMGDCTLTAKVGERPMLKFEFTGLDGGVAAQADTCLLRKTDAAAEAARRLAIVKVPRMTYRFEATPTQLLTELGSAVKLYSNRFGLATGKVGLVTSRAVDWNNLHITMEVTV